MQYDLKPLDPKAQTAQIALLKKSDTLSKRIDFIPTNDLSMTSITAPETLRSYSNFLDNVPISDASGSFRDNSNEENLSETLLVESDDDVLRSLGSVEGEELLAFIDHVRNAYDLDTDSLDLPQVINDLPFL